MLSFDSKLNVRNGPLANVFENFVFSVFLNLNKIYLILRALWQFLSSPVAVDLYKEISLEVLKRETVYSNVFKYFSGHPSEVNYEIELEIEKLCDFLFAPDAEVIVSGDHSSPPSTVESELDSFVDSYRDGVLNSSLVVRSELQLFRATGQRGKEHSLSWMNATIALNQNLLHWQSARLNQLAEFIFLASFEISNFRL